MDHQLEHSGKLFIISGPSGAGKGSICKMLLENVRDVEVSISMTTRKPRPGEVDGKSYYFATHEEFEDEIQKDGFLEYATVYGNYYGTPKQRVLDKLSQGIDVILEIDIQGALTVKESYPNGVFIFILPPSMAELRARLTGRASETESEVNMRLGETLKEIAYIDKYDYCVVNGKLDEATRRVQSILVAEHSKVSKDVYKLIQKYKEEI